MKYTFIVIVISAIIFAALGYQLYQKTLSNTEILKIQNPDIVELVNTQDRQILYLLGGALVLQIASLFILGILITHRIAGPMSRVHRYLKEIIETGELKPLDRIRLKDEFADFFGVLSQVVERFSNQSNQRKAKIVELQEALSQNNSSKAKQIAEELSKLV